VHFYELHEGDEDLFTDLLLTRETEMEPDVFFDIVQTIRRRVQDSFEQDTLIEAIAEELERDYDFLAITDDRLVAAVNVSKAEKENFLAELDPSDENEIGGAPSRSTRDDDDDDADDDDDEDDEEEDDEASGDLRSLYVDLDPNPDLRSN
jgi:hypothetical protein